MGASVTTRIPRDGIARRFGGYALVGGEKAARIGVGILVSGLISRALGVEGFGLFCSVIVLVTVMSPLASFGFESLGIALATRSDGAAAYIRRTLPLRLAAGCAGAIGFVIAALVLFRGSSPAVSNAAIVVLSSVFVLRLYEIGENILFSRERLAALTVIRSVAFLAASATIAIAVWFRMDVSTLLALSSLEALLLLVGYALAIHGDVRSAVGTHLEAVEWRGVLSQSRDAFPVFLSGALVLILLNMDKLLVFRFMNATDIGLYCSAARLVDALYFIPMVIGSVHAATFARLAGGDGFMPAYRSAFLSGTWMSLAAAVLLAALSGFVMPIVFGAPYADGAAVLALLAPGLVAVTWVSLRTRALAALDERREILKLSCVAFLLHTPLLAVGLWIGTIEAVATCQSLGWLIAAIVMPLLSPTAGMFSPLRMLRSKS